MSLSENGQKNINIYIILYWCMMITTDHHHIWVGTQLDDRTMASPGSTHQFSSLALPEQMKLYKYIWKILENIGFTNKGVL